MIFSFNHDLKHMSMDGGRVYSTKKEKLNDAAHRMNLIAALKRERKHGNCLENLFTRVGRFRKYSHQILIKYSHELMIRMNLKMSTIYLIVVSITSDPWCV